MSKSKRRIYKPESYESAKERDASANIYKSMLDSPAWRDLTSNQRVLYVHMKSQRYGAGRNRPDANDNSAFYFNKGVWGESGFGLYKDGNEKGFYRDAIALIEHGFIICVYSGAKDRAKSIYKYSSGWQLWPDYKPHFEHMTLPMQREWAKNNRQVEDHETALKCGSHAKEN